MTGSPKTGQLLELDKRIIALAPNTGHYGLKLNAETENRAKL